MKKSRFTEIQGVQALRKHESGPEFISKEFERWYKKHEIEIQYIQLVRPKQKRYIEKFNRVYRKAILDSYLFTDICEFRSLTEEWIEEYNEGRPHEALKNKTLTEWKQKIQH